MENVSLHIRGRVQGVGFRYNAKAIARTLGLSGYVKNMPDESVFIEIEGEEKVLDEFIHWCYQGPERAVVEDVKVEKGTVKNFKGFETRF